MVKILHSADWQMGLRARHVADVAAAVREARLAAARNVIQAANAKRVDAVVLAGDIFEDNLVEDRLVHAVLGILAECRSPVFILPGNHDALTPDAVYRRASWKQRPAHVRVLDTDAPVPIPGTPAVLLAAPLRQKKGMKDPTSVWCEQPRAEGIRIGVAHGSLRIPGKHSADDFPIGPDVVTRAGLDYLALGHWHGQYIHEERAAYAGAHETTKFDEPGAGRALLVEIAARGACPDLTPVPTGTLRWGALDLDLGEGMESEAQRARAWVAKEGPPETLLLRIRTHGVAPEEATSQLEGLREELLGRGVLSVVVERRDAPRAEVEGRLAEIAASSPLVGALLEGLAQPLTPGLTGETEAGRLAARRLLSELVLEAWR
ncbi:DNA repair exonuclease [Corallococcus sp. M34]|uniref:metallophosphoesterase family protein n=1 Tax=Citreicoccus inhibens TaxID=2849499 RepID=UPI001C2103DC|nr:DNA repair exonuclease [Citreicoccus inhibens]MBU8898332.1 DNA repair exonuclease [Citreicoccus inhibens]